MIEELWRKYGDKGTTEAREELIMACLPYIKSSAHRLAIYANPSQDLNDLISAGIIGLIDALGRYDPAKGASFKSYAKYRIRGSIIDEIRSMNWVPYSTREKARKIEKAYAEACAAERKADKTPDDEDIAKVMGISLSRYHEILLEVNRMTPSLLEDIFYDSDIPSDAALSTIYTSAVDRNPEEELVLTETETMLGNAIECLPEKERLIITLYYYEEMTMKEIGKVFDISESRVCQIHAGAILRLHTRLKYVGADISV